MIKPPSLYILTYGVIKNSIVLRLQHCIKCHCNVFLISHGTCKLTSAHNINTQEHKPGPVNIETPLLNKIPCFNSPSLIFCVIENACYDRGLSVNGHNISHGDPGWCKMVPDGTM